MLYEIRHHYIRCFCGLDVSAPSLKGALVPTELLYLSSRAKPGVTLSVYVKY